MNIYYTIEAFYKRFKKDEIFRRIIFTATIFIFAVLFSFTTETWEFVAMGIIAFLLFMTIDDDRFFTVGVLLVATIIAVTIKVNFHNFILGKQFK